MSEDVKYREAQLAVLEMMAKIELDGAGIIELLATTLVQIMSALPKPIQQMQMVNKAMLNAVSRDLETSEAPLTTEDLEWFKGMRLDFGPEAKKGSNSFYNSMRDLQAWMDQRMIYGREAFVLFATFLGQIISVQKQDKEVLLKAALDLVSANAKSVVV